MRAVKSGLKAVLWMAPFLATACVAPVEDDLDAVGTAEPLSNLEATNSTSPGSQSPTTNPPGTSNRGEIERLPARICPWGTAERCGLWEMCAPHHSIARVHEGTPRDHLGVPLSSLRSGICQLPASTAEAYALSLETGSCNPLDLTTFVETGRNRPVEWIEPQSLADVSHCGVGGPSCNILGADSFKVRVREDVGDALFASLRVETRDAALDFDLDLASHDPIHPIARVVELGSRRYVVALLETSYAAGRGLTGYTTVSSVTYCTIPSNSSP